MQKFGPFHIPLRVRRVPAPYRNASEYLDWCANQFGATWSNGGKRKSTVPMRMDFECPHWHEWFVETFDWYVPAQLECPRWHVLNRFTTRDDAVAFCERWRRQEREDEMADLRRRRR